MDSIAKVYVEYEYKFSLEFNEKAEYGNLNKNKAKVLRKNYYSLLANEALSLFKSLPKVNNELPDIDNYKVRFKTSTENTIFIKNTADSIVYQQISFPDNFLVKDSLEVFSWKIFREESESCGHKVRKAIWQNEAIEVIAWYSTKLNFPHGPENYWGLPGLILDLKISSRGSKKSLYSGRYSCSKIRSPKHKEMLIKYDNKGKRISPEKLKEYYKQLGEVYSN